MEEWLFYLIYPGRFEALDLILREIVAPSVDCARAMIGIEQWFYLRYFDERGPHLRLRFKGDAESISALQQAVDDLLSRELPRITRTSPQPMRGLLPLPYPVDTFDHVGYEYGMYEPEYEKYGGHTGVAIAEGFFHISSEIVLKMMLKQENLNMLSRALIALLLMHGAAKEALPEQQRDAYWERYSQYWLGGEGSAASRRMDTVIAAAQRRGDGVSRACTQLLLEEGIPDLVATYQAGVRDALSKAQQAGITVPSAGLCFHYMHLTNNRLGISPWDEGYLARLAQASSVSLKTVTLP